MAADAQVTFASLLRELRTSARLSQRGLAEAAGLSFRTVSDLERGVATTPQKDTVRLLADALHLTGPARTRFESVARGRDESAQAAAATRTLPRDIGSFTGRQQELDRLIEAAASAVGAVGIHAIGGMAGVGKTAFAVHAAHQLADRFPGGQIFLPLHGHTPGYKPVDPEDALASLLLIIGVLPGHIPLGLTARTALWRDRLAGQRVLLILDDAVDSEQVEPLLPGSSESLVLVTSRRHLSALDDATTISLDTLPAGEAAALLVRLTARPGLSPGDPAVAELVRLCGSLPLAIGMVARQLHHHPAWSLARRAAELASSRHRLELMATENVSVAAAFDLSYDDLDPDLQRLFRRLGLHVCAEFDGYVAAALDGTGLATASRGLEALYDHNLLTEPTQGRYRFHDLIREHSRILAARHDHDDDIVLARVLDYYQNAATRADASIDRYPAANPDPGGPAGVAAPDLGDSEQALAWLRTERASLLACLDYATAASEHRRVVALTGGLAGVLRLDGPWTDAISRDETAVTAARHLGDPLGEANALIDLGTVRGLTGASPAAIPDLERALDLYRNHGNHVGAANALCQLAVEFTTTNDFPAAGRAAQEALELYVGVGNRKGQAAALLDLGILRYLIGDYPAATRALSEALAHYRDLGYRQGQAQVLTRLGLVRELAGEYPAAAAAFEEALELYRDLGSRTGPANVLNQLGIIRVLTGDYPAAAKALDAALAIYRDIGFRIGEANALQELGILCALTGDYPVAARRQEEAMVIYRDIGMRIGEAHTLNALGAVARATGDYPSAVRGQEQALAIYRDAGYHLGEARALAELAAVHRLTGDLPAGAREIEQALGIYRDIGNRGGEVQALNEAGMVHRTTGELTLAERCHQQALVLARSIASPLDEARALAGLGRCALAVGDGERARSLLKEALDTFERLGSADAPALHAELDAFGDSQLLAEAARGAAARLLVSEGTATFLRLVQVGGRAVEPVLPSGREDVDVDRVLEEPELMGDVRRDDHDVARPHEVSPALRVHLGKTFGDPGDLLAGMVVERHSAALLRGPFHERAVRSLEVLPG